MIRNVGLLSVVTADLIGCTLAGVGLGYWLMKSWNAPWWVLLATTALGLVAAFFHLYRLSKRYWDR